LPARSRRRKRPPTSSASRGAVPAVWRSLRSLGLPRTRCRPGRGEAARRRSSGGEPRLVCVQRNAPTGVIPPRTGPPHPAPAPPGQALCTVDYCINTIVVYRIFLPLRRSGREWDSTTYLYYHTLYDRLYTTRRTGMLSLNSSRKPFNQRTAAGRGAQASTRRGASARKRAPSCPRRFSAARTSPTVGASPGTNVACSPWPGPAISA
jgi:hypothetical protein